MKKLKILNQRKVIYVKIRNSKIIVVRKIVRDKMYKSIKFLTF